MTAIDAIESQEISEQQRKFGEVRLLVGEIERLPGSNKKDRVKTNMGEFPFSTMGESSYILYHVAPMDREAYFHIQGSIKPEFAVGDGGPFVEIEADFAATMHDSYFQVRRGILSSDTALSEKTGEPMIPGSVSAIEITLEVLNIQVPNPSKNI